MEAAALLAALSRSPNSRRGRRTRSAALITLLARNGLRVGRRLPWTHPTDDFGYRVLADDHRGGPAWDRKSTLALDIDRHAAVTHHKTRLLPVSPWST